MCLGGVDGFVADEEGHVDGVVDLLPRRGFTGDVELHRVVAGLVKAEGHVVVGACRVLDHVAAVVGIKGDLEAAEGFMPREHPAGAGEVTDRHRYGAAVGEGAGGEVVRRKAWPRHVWFL